MAENIHQGYWAVVPAPILNDESMPPPAKLLYPVIASLAEQTGYCWASNEYLAKWFGVSERTVSRWVKMLEQSGYIRCEMWPTDVGHQRRIYVGIAVNSPQGGYRQKCLDPQGGVDKNVQGGVDKNVYPYLDVDKDNSDNTPPNPPKGGHGGRRRKTPRSAPDWEPERFAKLWEYYPHAARGNKQRAMDMWDKLKPSTQLINTIAKSLSTLKSSDLWRRGVGIPHVSTFLNPQNARWEDAANVESGVGAAHIEHRQTVMESRYEKL